MASRRTAFDTVLTPDSFMVAPETTGPSLSNLRGSKRGACDRCRGQKLRCMREDQSQDSVQATCVRCVKAGATCSFRIPSKRTGRPPASHALSSQGRKANDGGAASRSILKTSGLNGFSDSHVADGGQKECRVGERSSVRPLGENAVDHESEGETEDMSLVHAMSPWSLHGTSNMFGGVGFDFPAFSGSSTATLPWPDETMPSFYNDAGETSGFESFGAKWSRAFNTYEAQPMEFQIPNASPVSNEDPSKDMSVNAPGAPAQTYITNTQISGLSDEGMDLDLPRENTYASQFSPTKAQNPQLGLSEEDRDKGRPHEYASLGMSSTESTLFKDFSEKEAGVNYDEETLSVHEIQQRRMQELSELAMDLYTQLAANDPQKYQPTSRASATGFQDQLVGSVLKSSNTFLTLLTSLFAPSTSSSPDPTVSTNQNSSSCNSSDSDNNSDASSPVSLLYPDDSAMEDESVQQQHRFRRNLPTGSSADLSSKPRPPIDMATILQLLTCYMHIIHLHSIMHARLLDYMLAFLPNQQTNTNTNMNTNNNNNTTPPLDISVPPVFPGMQVGGVSLDQFGTFQVNLLLQISMHLLGEIELALGLPKEYSVGKRKGSGRGVLEASVSSSFVKCLMREEAWRGKRVECVRDRLAYLRRVLKGAVDYS